MNFYELEYFRSNKDLPNGGLDANKFPEAHISIDHIVSISSLKKHYVDPMKKDKTAEVTMVNGDYYNISEEIYDRLTSHIYDK